jgi:hypothetical protein
MGFIRQCLQAQPKKIKNVIETPKQPIEIKKSQIKVCCTSKVKKRKNSYGGYPTEYAGSTQNPKKIISTPSKKEKEPKIRLGATRRNLQAQLKILKKSSKQQILPIRTKIFPKKLCFLP